jgi:hypothetical protein
MLNMYSEMEVMKVRKWKSCHQEREFQEPFAVTMDGKAFVVTCSLDREKQMDRS